MRKTSKPNRRPRSNVLQVRVMSPRIAWYGFVKTLGKLTKFAVILAVISLAGYGIWRGVQRAFYDNPDFRLQVVDLNPNSAIDEFSLIQIANIDLSANLFDLDVDAITASLETIPALSSVKVERHLPGTLSVRVAARTPRAWIACPEAGIPATRKVDGLLIDESGAAFPCTTLQFETAERLPIILLPAREEHPLAAGKRILHPELQRCFRLLDTACATDPEAIHWIESVQQSNAWSLSLITRDGAHATFGLGDHERQIANFRAAVEHLSKTGESIATINLIPKENVPVTVRNETTPPRATPVPEPTPTDVRRDRSARDLNTLLNSR
jgi:cell division septal protein FtsQ